MTWAETTRDIAVYFIAGALFAIPFTMLAWAEVESVRRRRASKSKPPKSARNG